LVEARDQLTVSELAESLLKLLANLTSAFSKVAGTLPAGFLKSLEKDR
jgi:hypothetical protein